MNGEKEFKYVATSSV